MEKDILVQNIVEEKLFVENIGGNELPKKKKENNERGQLRELYATKKEPKKSLTNFQRNQFRTLFSSMALSDRKSMILVRISTTLLSALIVFHSYIEQNVPLGSVVLITAIVGVGISLVFGLLSSKPSGIEQVLDKQIIPKYPNLKNNVLLFFTQPTLDEYEEAMDEVVRSQELQIGNQVRTSYLINSMLLRQYRLLTLSYLSFIITFVAVIGIFLIGMLL
ncbi:MULTISPECIES: Pycsar system effector family protein [unclassified Saccharicrinis]|uniref:Pycsar system effector family protein n=1 Tax=unclassified Saccharicrinis TaxID=2646859 RepID=UPI003D341C8B